MVLYLADAVVYRPSGRECFWSLVAVFFKKTFPCGNMVNHLNVGTIPLKHVAVLMIFILTFLQGGEEEAALAVEVGDMQEAEVTSTMVATVGGRTVTGAFLTKRGAYWGAMLKGTDLVQQEEELRF